MNPNIVSELFYIITHHVEEYGVGFLCLCMGCFLLSVSVFLWKLIRTPIESNGQLLKRLDLVETKVSRMKDTGVVIEDYTNLVEIIGDHEDRWEVLEKLNE